MNRKILLALVLMLSVSMVAVFAQSQGSAPAEGQAVEQAAGASSGLKYVAAALAVGIACIGAMSENAELSGKALPFVGLAEGICLWGFLVALFIILM